MRLALRQGYETQHEQTPSPAAGEEEPLVPAQAGACPESSPVNKGWADSELSVSPWCAPTVKRGNSTLRCTKSNIGSRLPLYLVLGLLLHPEHRTQSKTPNMRQKDAITK